MEIDQRSVVSYFHCKGMKLPAIVAELAAVYHEDAFDESRVKYWPHEIKLNCSDLSDRPSSGRAPPEDIDVRILKVLEAGPWFWVQMIAWFLKIPPPTGRPHRTTSLNMKSRHFNWVPHFRNDDLTAKRLEGARQLLDVVQVQQGCHF
jgi:hypothetical protein